MAGRLEEIEGELTRRIVSGELAPGVKLPALRALAADFGVTLPTAQRVVAALEARGLVEVKAGSGCTVVDPMSAGLAMLPVWFATHRDQPEVLVSVLREFLRMRRVLTVDVLVQHRAGLAEWGPAVLRLPSGPGVQALMDADLATTHAILERTGQIAMRFLFGSMAQLVRSTPSIYEALYADPAHHAATMAAVVGALASPLGDEEAQAQVLAAQESWDEAAIGRFQAHLAEG